MVRFKIQLGVVTFIGEFAKLATLQPCTAGRQKQLTHAPTSQFGPGTLGGQYVARSRSHVARVRGYTSSLKAKRAFARSVEIVIYKIITKPLLYCAYGCMCVCVRAKIWFMCACMITQYK